MLYRVSRLAPNQTTDRVASTWRRLGSGLPPESPDMVVVTSGDISLLDADILAGLVATHNSPSAAVTC